MPAVDVAMVRSLRGGLWETVKDTIARSLATEVVRRDIVADADNKISDVKQAFSSWGACMAHVYCKYVYLLPRNMVTSPTTLLTSTPIIGGLLLRS